MCPYDITLKNISAVTRELSIIISSESIEKEIELTCKNLSKKVQIKGFRRGRAPLYSVKKYYKEKIESDVFDKMIKESYAEALKRYSLNPVSQPRIRINSINSNNEGNFSYTAELEVRPKINIEKWENLKIRITEYQVTQDDIDENIKRLQRQHGELVPVKDRDVATLGDMAECLADGESRLYNVNKNSPLLTKKINEEFLIENPSKKEKMIRLKILSLKKIKLPELSDAFAQSVSDSKTMQELESKIKTFLQQEKETLEKIKKREAVLDALIKNNPFEIPESMIDFQSEQIAINFLNSNTREKHQTIKIIKIWEKHKDELKESFKKQAKKSIQAFIICESLALMFDIKIKEKDIEDELELESRRLGVNIDELKLRQKDEDIEKIKKKLTVNKALEKVLNVTEINFKKKETLNEKH